MKETNKKTRILTAIIICLCLIIIGGVVCFKNQNHQNGTTDSAFEPDLDPDAKVQSDEESGNKPSGIRIPGYPSVTIASDTKDVKMNLMNPEGNPCYFTFEIVLKENDETIYTSKMVEPGKAITDVTLSKGLSKGEHPAVIKISTASLEDGTAMNGADVETVLIAE